MSVPPHPSLVQFDESIRRVRDLGGLYVALVKFAPPLLDPSDIVRAQLVQLVSALDFYVHDLVRREMLEIARGGRANVPQFGGFRVPLEKIQSMVQALHTTLPPLGDPMPALPQGLPGLNHLEAEIQEQLAIKSFQDPDKIADGIRLICSKDDLWKLVAGRMSMDKADVKQKLKLIVKRRNQIAHEADMDPSVPGTRWPISESEVTDSVDFIEQIVHSIHDEII